MTRHWKSLVWFAIVAVSLGVLAFTTTSYLLAYALAFAIAVVGFVLAAAWMDEGKPSRRRRPAPR